MMMKDHKVWNFKTLIDEYLADRIYFRKAAVLKSLPWSLQIEIKRITSALNAFTNGNYNAETVKGKIEIQDAFEMGLGLQDKKCSDGQLQQLQELLPNGDELFIEFDERPSIGDFYRYLFAVYKASFDYVTIFDEMTDDKYTDGFNLICTLKQEKIDTHIIEKSKIIYRAIKVLLAEMCNKSFTKTELIERYDYPDVDYERLVRYNKKWCRFHGIKFKDYRKSTTYSDKPT